MAETCCAEENEINYQIDCFEGFVSEKVREIDKEECLSVKSVFTRPLLQKGSSLQEEILSVCGSVDLFVRHHFFLLRIFNDLMV